MGITGEGMRLFPPAWLTTREVVQPTTIRGVDLAVGAQVIVSPWLTQRDPRWWPDADEFRIDRWLYPDEQRPKWAYFPFGGGARGCIGEHFAMLEATIILAEVARRWTISPAGDAPEPEAGSATSPAAASAALRSLPPIGVRRCVPPERIELPTNGVETRCSIR